MIANIFCAFAGAILFFVLSDMATVNPMYQYSLANYLEVFKISLKKSIPDSILEKRLRNIIDTLTYNVYNYACTGTNHIQFCKQYEKQLFYNGDISGPEYPTWSKANFWSFWLEFFDFPFNFFLTLQQLINRSIIFQSMWELLFWLPASNWVFIVPTFDTKVTDYLCSGWVFFFFRQISTF